MQKKGMGNRFGAVGADTSVGIKMVFVQKVLCFPEINNETKYCHDAVLLRRMSGLIPLVISHD
jgi:hypothetical protein